MSLKYLIVTLSCHILSFKKDINKLQFISTKASPRSHWYSPTLKRRSQILIRILLFPPSPSSHIKYSPVLPYPKSNLITPIYPPRVPFQGQLALAMRLSLLLVEDTQVRLPAWPALCFSVPFKDFSNHMMVKLLSRFGGRTKGFEGYSWLWNSGANKSPFSPRSNLSGASASGLAYKRGIAASSMTDKEGGDSRAGYLYFDINRSGSISFILKSQNTFLLAFCELRALFP